MNNDSDTYIYDCPTGGMFRVMHRGSCVAIFNYCREDESGFFTKKQAKKLANKLARKTTFYYCTEGEEGHFTKKQAKKLTEKLVRKIENSTTIKTKKGFKLKRNNNDQRQSKNFRE